MFHIYLQFMMPAHFENWYNWAWGWRLQWVKHEPIPEMVGKLPPMRSVHAGLQILGIQIGLSGRWNWG